jgi:uncharacterized membrane protein
MTSGSPGKQAKQAGARWETPALLATLVIALVVRLAGAGQSLFLDEFYSLEVAGYPAWEIPRILASNDTHPPLHYLFLHFWIKPCSTDVWLRLPGVILGVAVCYLAYLTALQFVEKRLALAAALLAATSPGLVGISQVCRDHTFMPFWLMLSTYLAVRYWRQQRIAYLVGYVATAIAGMYTFYYFAYIIAAQSLALMLVAGRNRWKLGVRWIIGLAVASAAFSPWLPTMQGQAHHATGLDAHPPLTVRLAYDTLLQPMRAIDPATFLRVRGADLLTLAILPVLAILFLMLRRKAPDDARLSELRRAAFFMLAWTGVLAALAGLAAASGKANLSYHEPNILAAQLLGVAAYAWLRRGRLRKCVAEPAYSGAVYLAVVILGIVGIAYAGALVANIFLFTRYLFFLCALIAVLAAIIASQLGGRAAWVTLAVLLAINCAGLPNSSLCGDDIRGATEYISTNIEPDGCIYTCASYVSLCVPRYLKKDVPVFGVSADEPPTRAPKLAPVAKRGELMSHRSIWMIWAHTNRENAARCRWIHKWLRDNGYRVNRSRMLTGVIVEEYCRTPRPQGQRGQS